MRARSRRLQAIHGTVRLGRDAAGVPQIEAEGAEDAAFALGWLHGTDRGAQVALMRIAGQGRLCECVADRASLLEVDRYYRRLGLARDARAHAGELPARHRHLLDAYCRGVNAAWARRSPWALRLYGYRPEPYTPADALLLVKLLSFTGLAESQRIEELFIVHALRRGLDEPRLRALFPALGEIDVSVIRGLTGVPPLFPGDRSAAHLPMLGASNAWVVHGARTGSGAPLLANDPHLEVSRLPALLYEAVLCAGGRTVRGAGVPGLPGIIVGRTEHLAWGVTYSCADTSDFFVERCRDGAYLREGGWQPFRVRRELIRRRDHAAEELLCYENDHGVLEGDAAVAGDYLSWSWSGSGRGGTGALRAFLDLPRCTSVPAAQATARGLDIPTLHMVFADRDGNIGYQYAGATPARRPGLSGLAPVPGWNEANDWRGMVDPDSATPSLLNPECGYIATANEARQSEGGPVLTTVALAGYRRARIEQLIEQQGTVSVRDAQGWQYDLLSLQARRFLPEYLEHVPPGDQRELLERWDCRYVPEALAPTLFENLHVSVLVEVFGGRLGRDWARYLIERTILYPALAGAFDDVLAVADSVWLPAAERRGVLARGVAAGLAAPLEPWGRRNRVVFANMFSAGRLPAMLGFDYGPVALPGNHATVHQGTTLRVGGRTSNVAACYRFVADLAEEGAWTNLPGGPSESRFSRHYRSDLTNWLRARFKRI